MDGRRLSSSIRLSIPVRNSPAAVVRQGGRRGALPSSCSRETPRHITHKQCVAYEVSRAPSPSCRRGNDGEQNEGVYIFCDALCKVCCSVAPLGVTDMKASRRKWEAQGGGTRDWYSWGRLSGPEGKAGPGVCEFLNRGIVFFPLLRSAAGWKVLKNWCHYAS
ncbi:hypothetical protein E2C01_037355 [Portunus trituberculatus]|uniref:Uncharacterized protein n=1 Tax=Portunus trituberculatus TaxID=210409 RepID=A0A5B7FF37_PORTR|nr:hypothetical protein [Portunus trituberculatus]